MHKNTADSKLCVFRAPARGTGAPVSAFVHLGLALPRVIVSSPLIRPVLLAQEAPFPLDRTLVPDAPPPRL